MSQKNGVYCPLPLTLHFSCNSRVDPPEIADARRQIAHRLIETDNFAEKIEKSLKLVQASAKQGFAALVERFSLRKKSILIFLRNFGSIKNLFYVFCPVLPSETAQECSLAPFSFPKKAIKILIAKFGCQNTVNEHFFDVYAPKIAVLF